MAGTPQLHRGVRHLALAALGTLSVACVIALHVFTLSEETNLVQNPPKELLFVNDLAKEVGKLEGAKKIVTVKRTRVGNGPTSLGFMSGRESHEYDTGVDENGTVYYRCGSHSKWGLSPCVHEYNPKLLVPGVWENAAGLESREPALQDFAFSNDWDPIIGDTGSARYRPAHYMDWDGTGRGVPAADTMPEESFGAPFAAPRRRTGLATTPTQKLDIPDDWDPVGGAAGYPKETAQHASGEQNYGPGASRPDDADLPAYDFWYGRGRRSTAASRQKLHAAGEAAATATAKAPTTLMASVASAPSSAVETAPAQPVLAASVPAASTAIAAATPVAAAGAQTASVVGSTAASVAAAANGAALVSELESQLGRAQARLAAEEGAAAERGALGRLETSIADAQARLDQALAARGNGGAEKQALTLRQERDGEWAEPALGRQHGCAPNQIRLFPEDDCDPLADKMLADAQDINEQLAAHRVGAAGVHWTSGDVDPREDAIPLRERGGGYSGIADIEYPADRVYATLYRPVLDGQMNPSHVGTKAHPTRARLAAADAAAADAARAAAAAAALRRRIAALRAAEQGVVMPAAPTHATVRRAAPSTHTAAALADAATTGEPSGSAAVAEAEAVARRERELKAAAAGLLREQARAAQHAERRARAAGLAAERAADDALHVREVLAGLAGSGSAPAPVAPTAAAAAAAKEESLTAASQPRAAKPAHEARPASHSSKAAGGGGKVPLSKVVRDVVADLRRDPTLAARLLAAPASPAAPKPAA